MFVKKSSEENSKKSKFKDRKLKTKSFISIFNKTDNEFKVENNIEILESNSDLNLQENTNSPNKDDVSPNTNSLNQTDNDNLITENMMDNEQNAFAKAIEDGFTKMISAFAPKEEVVNAEVETKLAESEALVASLKAQVETLTSEKSELESKVLEFEAKAEADTKALAEKQEELIQADYIARATSEFSHLVGTPEEIAAKLRTIDAIEDEATKTTVLEALKTVNESNSSLTSEQGSETSSEELTAEEALEKKIYAKAEELFAAEGNKMTIEQCVIKAEELISDEQ